MEFKRKNQLGLLALLFFSVLLVFYVFQTIGKTQLVSSDEGDYIWTGNVVRQAIKQKNWPLFWQLTKDQFHYPFFQSWYLAFSTLPFEYTVESSRLSSLILLLPTIVLAWFLGRELDKKLKVSLLASGFVLTSPMILYYYSTAMKEGIATCLTLLVLFFYFLGRKKNSLKYFFITGLFATVLTLTKYNFGGLIIIAIGIESLFWLFENRSFRDKNYWLFNIILSLPLVLTMGYWIFFLGNNISDMLSQGKDVFNLNQTNTLGHLLYYPAEMAFSYTFSWVVFVLLAAGFLFATRYWKDYKIRLLSFFFLTNFILAEKHMINNQGRYIFTSVPAFFLVGSFGLVRLLEKIKKVSRITAVSGFLIPFLLVVSYIVIKDLLIFPKMIAPTGSHQVQSAVFYEQDYLNISNYNFNRQSWPKIPPKLGSEKISELIGFVVQNTDLSKNISLVGGINELNRGIFDFYIDKAREAGIVGKISALQQYVVVLQVGKDTRFDTFDYHFSFGKQSPQPEAVLSDKSFQKVAQKTFEDLGLIVTILGR